MTEPEDDPVLVQMQEQLDDHARRLGELDDVILSSAAPGGPPAAEPAADAPPPMFASVHDWVDGHFAQVYVRPLGGQFRWCARWWEHAEAIIRLEALWRTWEQLRLDPVAGMATWLRDHLDHHLPILMGASGPFAMCSEDRHEGPAGPLATTPARGE